MNRFFLDLGANNGCSVRQFISQYNPRDWTIFSFEADPDLAKHFPVVNETFINKAVWIYDGVIDFWKSNKKGSSTLIHNKVIRYPTQHWTKIEIPCIDFDRWIGEKIKIDDYVILKIDIEGAEYQILNKLMLSGNINLINEVWGELHGSKIGKEKEEELMLQKLSQFNLHIKPWDAL